MRALAFSGDSALLAASSLDGSVIVWKMAEPPLRVGQPLRAHRDGVNSVAFDSEIPGRLVTASRDKDVILWALDGYPLNGRELSDLASEPMANAFDPGTGDLALASRCGPVTVVGGLANPSIAYGLGRDPSPSPCPCDGEADSCWISAIEYLAGRDRLVTADRGGRLAIWDAKGGAPLSTAEGHLANSTAWPTVVADNDGDRLLSYDEDDGMVLFDTMTGLFDRPLFDHRTRCSEDDAAEEAAPTAQADRGAGIQRAGCAVTAAAFKADGEILVTGDATGRLLSWDSRSGAMLGMLEDMGTEIAAIAFNPVRSDQMLVALRVGSVSLWTLSADGMVTRKADGPVIEVPLEDGPLSNEIWSLAVNADGTRIAIGTKHGRVHVYDLEQRLPIGIALAGHNSRCVGLLDYSRCRVTSLSFHPSDPDLLVSSSPWGRTIAWRLDAGSLENAICRRANRTYTGEDLGGWALEKKLVGCPEPGGEED